MPIDLSPDDTQRFGIRSAKGFVTHAHEVPPMIEFCDANGVEFAIVRCPTEQMSTVHALEDHGLQLMDTLVFFSTRLDRWEAPSPADTVVTRTLRRDETDTVTRIAKEAFRAYFGHYHADPRLDRAACDALYVDWSLRLCLADDPSSRSLLAIVDGEPAGYMTFRWKRGEYGEAVLGGVLEGSRRRGVYRTLLADGITWLRDQGAETVVLSTQISNVAVQKVWTRLGFGPHHAVYTFHGWF